jgi:hypothetical protein
MHKLAVLSTLVLSASLVTACDRSTPTVVAPTTVNAAGVSADVRVAAAVVDPVSDRSCRALTIPLDLIVRAGDLAVSLTGVRMRFEGSSDVPTPQTLPPAPLSPPAPIPTNPAPVPTTQFGSDLMDARSVRTFPLSLPIGCVNPNGTVIVIVDTRDGLGRRGSVEVRKSVR